MCFDLPAGGGEQNTGEHRGRRGDADILLPEQGTAAPVWASLMENIDNAHTMEAG